MTAKEQLIITDNSLEEYRKILQNEEKKSSTIEKYIRDVKKLRDFAKGQPITQALHMYKGKCDFLVEFSLNTCYIDYTKRGPPIDG